MKSTDRSWIDLFHKDERNILFIEVDKNYIDHFNLEQVNYNFEIEKSELFNIIANRKSIGDLSEKYSIDLINRELSILYCFIHSEYSLTDDGLSKYRKKLSHNNLIGCPRVSCKNYQCVPFLNIDSNGSSIKLYCHCCRERYEIPSYLDIFTSSFQLKSGWLDKFTSKYKDDLEANVNLPSKHVPKIFGFKVRYEPKLNDKRKKMELVIPEIQEDILNSHIINGLSINFVKLVDCYKSGDFYGTATKARELSSLNSEFKYIAVNALLKYLVKGGFPNVKDFLNFDIDLKGCDLKAIHICENDVKTEMTPGLFYRIREELGKEMSALCIRTEPFKFVLNRVLSTSIKKSR